MTSSRHIQPAYQLTTQSAWLAKPTGSTSSELVFGKPAEVFGKLSETELTGMILNKLVHAATNAGNPANTTINEVSELVEYIRRMYTKGLKLGK